MDNVNSYVNVGKNVKNMLDYYDVDNYNEGNIEWMLDKFIDYVEKFGIEVNVNCNNFYNEMMDKVDILLFDVYMNEYSDLEVGKKVVNLFI